MPAPGLDGNLDHELNRERQSCDQVTQSDSVGLGGPAMPQWEYITIHLSELPRETDEVDLLNEAGEDGWELAGITANNVAYLKRQVTRSTAPSRVTTRRK